MKDGCDPHSTHGLGTERETQTKDERCHTRARAGSFFNVGLGEGVLNPESSYYWVGFTTFPRKMIFLVFLS